MTISLDQELLLELASLESRLIEDRLYQIAILEIEAEQFDLVAQAKALEEAEGDTQKARAFYTKHRVRRMKDMIAQFTEEERKAEEEKNLKKRKAKQEEENEQILSFFRGAYSQKKGASSAEAASSIQGSSNI